MRRFKAAIVSAADVPELDVFAVVLAENADGSGRRVEIQRSRSHSEEDRMLRQDTYCICTDGAAYYGGIRYYRLSDARLEMRLDAKAAEALRVAGGGFFIEMSVDAEQRHALNEGLRRVIGSDS